ncbi:PQ loop repeat-domain-containing protein [Roridomyces roridus]|uniref:PQ loop repeat-domain-containing protein n=1 Tax=Roridomyces roridus TaxID=1738132 RepID=A0AAD7BWU9_9AGAR|nr:PQ loop repeat-domain-containing protein [Roridomyces roridus]
MSYTLSDLLGYTSIGCWLGAQFPQVITNIRLRSCEGLALPFLANWFLGDASNLIGCLMTHQLPFQTWLATYFVFVDVLLVSQYFYYEGFRPSPSFARSRGGSIHADRYRTLSVVAANVSAAAALAAQQEDLRQGSDRMSSSRVSDDFGTMADSFHSEGGLIPTRKRVSWSTERYGKRGGSVGRAPMTRSAILPPRASMDDTLDRGRSLQRDPSTEPPTESPTQDPSLESRRRNSRVSRRGANLVFLSVFALYGVSAWSANGLPTRLEAGVGRVLNHRRLQPFRKCYTLPDLVTHRITTRIPSDPSSERILGRFFAWLCTTLYLTSRLPQIWKNFARKSVEGLSMYLFIFAFLGNSFYVASILTSEQVYQPPPASSEFLRESLPYLLGSGGTLMFDVMIVSQSWLYRKRAPRRHGKGRTLGEEEACLLSAETST